MSKWPEYEDQQLVMEVDGEAFRCEGCNHFREGELYFNMSSGRAYFCARCVEYALALLWRFKLTTNHVR
jgi:hypothetical protein